MFRSKKRTKLREQEHLLVLCATQNARRERFIKKLLHDNACLRNELYEDKKEISWHWPQRT